jgi:peroxiredoxin
VAGLLCVGKTAYVGAIAAFVLFLLFTALVAWNLRLGRRPACACFGEATAAPLSNWTLVRDLIFAALAGAIVAGGPEGTPNGVIGGLAGVVSAWGTDAALAGILLIQGAILVGLWARATAARTPSSDQAATAAPQSPGTPSVGWPPGTLAPGFDLPSIEGDRIAITDLIARGRNVVLIFTAADCSHCAALLPEVARWQEQHAQELSVVVVSRGTASENRAKAEEFGVKDVLLQGGSEVAEAYRALAIPAAVVVDGSRRLGSRLANGAVEIRQLVEAWAARSRADAPESVPSPAPPKDPSRLLAGDPAPPFRLPSLRGGEVDLQEVAGRIVALLFWNPGCRYCRELAPELREREKSQTELSVQMLFLATGTREANEAESFLSPLLLDHSGVVQRAYGVHGTPSAVLIDAGSRVASAVAVGAMEIRTLLQRADLMARAAGGGQETARRNEALGREHGV